MNRPRTLVANQLKEELRLLFQHVPYGDDPERDTAKMLEILSEYCWYMTPENKLLTIPNHIR